jgi:hypothetical protein
MFRHLFRAGFVALAIGLVACGESAPTAPDVSVELSPTADLTLPPDGGTCPDVYYEQTELLDNGVTVAWTSTIAGFEYAEGTDYVGTVNWSVDQGSTEYTAFTIRNGRNAWTPRGKGGDDVNGTMTPGTAGAGTVDVTVNMTPMHASEDDYDLDGINDWEGQIGNGHFWLRLRVDDGEGDTENVKLGVNFHLEDPADGFGSRCPS